MITMTLLLLSCQWKPLNLIFNFTVAILCAKTFFATGAVVFSRVSFVFICFFFCRCPSNRSEYEDSSHQDEFQQDQNYWRFLPGNLFYNFQMHSKLPEKYSPERRTSVRSYKPILSQNGALRRCWTLAHSTCRTGLSCKKCSPNPCFIHRVDAKPPVFRDYRLQSPLFWSIEYRRTKQALRLHGKISSC